MNTVIETKPTDDLVETKKSEINPSKAAIVKPVMNQPMSSVVHIVASQPQAEVITEEQSDEQPKVVKIIPEPSVEIVTTIEDDQSKIVFEQNPSIITKVEIVEDRRSIVVPQAPSPIVSSHVEIREELAPSLVVAPMQQAQSPLVVLSSIVEVSSSEDVEPVLQVENNIGEPEYDFLSRQPSEFAEETYRIHNIKPSAARTKTRSSAEPKKSQSNNRQQQDSLHPTGLVTKLGGTVVKDGATTVHETSVIGTYISGKYAQVLQSTSHIFSNAKAKISPTSSLRILKTAAPHVPKSKHVEATQIKAVETSNQPLPIEDLYGNSPGTNLVRSSRRPATSSGSFKNRFRNRNSKDDAQDYQEVTAPDIQATPAYNSPKKSRNNKSKK